MKKIMTVFLIMGAIMTLVFLSCHQTKDIVLNLESKQMVDNYAKIKVSPNPLSLKNNIKFVVEIESFQNPELLTLNLKNTALLEDNAQNLYTPIKWLIIKKDKYQTVGELTFKPISGNTSEIKLKLFPIGNHAFIWKLPKTGVAE